MTNLLANSVIHGFDDNQAGHLSIVVAPPGAIDDPLCLVYADDGKGIPPECRHRVFDPFYTTRRGRGGSGLGLHIVYNLVTTRLGGDIRLESGEPSGTRFVLHLSRHAPPGGGADG
jgi:signal transduction histidine kinase